MKLRLGIAAAAVLLALGGAGCAMLGPCPYNVVWENHTGAKLKDVRISYGEFTTTFGIHLMVTEPLPEVADVQFRTPDGVLHRRQVPIPMGFRRNIREADLMFFIEPDLSVSVHLRSREQRKAQAGTL